MPKNITLMGASYSDVPGVTLPQTGGGTAYFADVSPTTAIESDVTSGKTFFKADGTPAIGTSSGGGSAADPTKPVKFIDYDGKLLYSYTAAELQALDALPANPSHTGLTAEGWNYTLAQAKAQVTAMGEAIIGQMYVTDDNKTRIYCHFESGRLSPYLGICPNGTVTVDWGDNSATNTLTGTSETTVKYIQHIYAAAGDYVITLTAAAGTTFAFHGTSTYYSYILRKNTDSTNSKKPSDVYRNAIQKIELGSSVKIGNYAFYDCYSLASITIPSSVTSIGNYAFYACYSLASITIPSGVTSIGTYAFYACSSLASITIPNGVTSIGTQAFYSCKGLASITIPSGVTSIETYVFYDCSSLTSITIPNGVTSIGAYAFNSCYGMAEYHLKPTTPPTLSNTNAFTYIQSDCIIYVPKSENQTILNAYKTASNWSTYASYMQEEAV